MMADLMEEFIKQKFAFPINFALHAVVDDMKAGDTIGDKTLVLTKDLLTEDELAEALDYMECYLEGSKKNYSPQGWELHLITKTIASKLKALTLKENNL